MQQICWQEPGRRGIITPTSVVINWSMPLSVPLSQSESSVSAFGFAHHTKGRAKLGGARVHLRTLRAKLLRSIGVFGALGCLFGTGFDPAHAYAPAIQFVPGTSPTGDPYPITPIGSNNLTFGYEFNTLIDRVVDGIAVFDHNNDGLNQFHKVGFWKTDWQGVFQLIGQYAFDPASPTCVSESMWCWISIPLLTMNRDSRYMIAATWDQAALPKDLLAYDTPPPGTGQSYVTIDSDLNFIYPVRSDPVAVESVFGVNCPKPTPVNVDFSFDPNDLSTLCAFPSRRVDVDAGGYFSAVVSFYNPSVQTPAPLPLLGASAMFAWKRRLRKRINTAT